ncbi:ABC transporter ATP-binding protein [Clostridium oryzae]|uniref:Putative multidrug export ATP-binding/permease protein n=1 Tax=Clostridium oryzae TaxID=1450648 RepID=A0A1V4IW94_9CLOT|nr:ABC transporter ATP-binding protein [Clostridium oryzae]OPJ64163.1 putative multidrug export ATP-binding/permease protein [Clostridium oryzae]
MISDKSTTRKNIKRFFLMIFKQNRKLSIVAFVIMLIVSALDLTTPQIMQRILDDAIKLGKIKLLLALAILYALINIVSAAFEVGSGYIYSKIKNGVTVKLKVKLLKHLGKLSGDYYTNIKSGNMLQVMENDIYIVESMGIELVISLVSDAFMAVIALFFLIRMQWDLLLLLMTLEIALGFTQSKFTKILSRKTNELRDDSGVISNLVQEYISNIMLVVMSKSIPKFFRNYIKKEKDILKKYIHFDMIISGNSANVKVVSALITVFTYGYGGYKIIKGHMTFGELIAFEQYVSMFMGPSMRIIRSNTTIQQSAVSINRIFAVIDEPVIIEQDNDGEVFNKDSNGYIEFKHVDFSYGDGSDVINDVNMKFEKGKVSAIVGSTGCGKSTIIKLLFRLWEVNNGCIYIDRVSLKKYNLRNLRKNIAIITQDLLLFDDTIINNITLENKYVSRAEVEYICKKVQIYDFIASLPNGFDTVIGEDGVKLSGGQKQKISIARALLGDSRVIVFDEATSALDNVSQQNIMGNISEFLKNRTTIVIAHRLSTIRNADIIYVMDGGRIVEQGTHDELICKNGHYYNLYYGENIEMLI